MSNDLFSVIGNSVRAKILMCLAERPKTVSELIENCGLAQSAVSQHLSKLKSVGLLDTTKNGTNVTYSLKYKKAAEISQLLTSLNQELK